jgi:hypothetical protein
MGFLLYIVDDKTNFRIRQKKPGVDSNNIIVMAIHVEGSVEEFRFCIIYKGQTHIKDGATLQAIEAVATFIGKDQLDLIADNCESLNIYQTTDFNEEMVLDKFHRFIQNLEGSEECVKQIGKLETSFSPGGFYNHTTGEGAGAGNWVRIDVAGMPSDPKKRDRTPGDEDVNDDDDDDDNDKPETKKPKVDDKGSEDDPAKDDDDKADYEDDGKGSDKPSNETDKDEAKATKLTRANKFIEIYNKSSIESILEMVHFVDYDLEYMGFSPKKTREAFVSGIEDDVKIAKKLMLVFTAYAAIGNNSGNLAKKRVNIDVGTKINTLIVAMRIGRKTSESSGFTLARLAIAFMPEYLMYRRYVVKKLTDQAVGTISAEYKDLCFYGCSRIREMSGYKDYHKNFSALIYKPGVTIELDDKEFLSSLKKFAGVSEKGFVSDEAIHKRMDDAISMVQSDGKNALNWIISSIAIYRATKKADDKKLEEQVEATK